MTASTTSTNGQVIQRWREAMGEWRQTGDVTTLAEVAAQMEPAWRRVFLDAILPTGLRRDVESLLRRQAPAAVRPRTAA